MSAPRSGAPRLLETPRVLATPRSLVTPRRLAILRRFAALVAVGLALSCAKREPPSGGPPDLDPPRLVSSAPDSGAAGVARDARMSLTFSESMEPRSTGESVSLAPRIAVRQRHWSGRTLTLVLEEPLRADQTYTLFVSNTARDRHGNPMAAGGTVVFTTRAAFPTGRIEGVLDAKGFAAPGTSLWCYDAERTGPDSTARDFDALGLVDTRGAFRVDGLEVPGRYRLWAFADLNANRSFEPASDVLAPGDTVIALDAANPVASRLSIRVVNPRAPGTLRGTVLDSLPDSAAVVRVLAVSADDSTARGLADVDRDGAWELSLRAGVWIVRGFRDDDRDRAWNPARERASDSTRVVLPPAGEVPGIDLVLRARLRGP